MDAIGTIHLIVAKSVRGAILVPKIYSPEDQSLRTSIRVLDGQQVFECDPPQVGDVFHLVLPKSSTSGNITTVLDGGRCWKVQILGMATGAYNSIVNFSGRIAAVSVTPAKDATVSSSIGCMTWEKYVSERARRIRFGAPLGEAEPDDHLGRYEALGNGRKLPAFPRGRLVHR